MVPILRVRCLVRQSTGPDDLVLDFFAGSATTAQAVMELNAEDGGSRRFIMVSSTEATEDDPDKNLCRDVTAERIRLLNASDDKRQQRSPQLDGNVNNGVKVDCQKYEGDEEEYPFANLRGGVIAWH